MLRLNFIVMRIMCCLFVLSFSGCSALIKAEAAGSSNTTRIDTPLREETTAVFPTINPTQTIQPTSTLRASATPIPTNTLIPSLTPYPSPTPLPQEFFIRNITGHRQAYAISCESSAAADWAGFFDVQAYEADIQFKLPISDNPDNGFVGDVHDPWGQVPPYSYGVHAEPIAKVLRDEYNLPATAAKNFTLEALKAEIANNQPVIAWVIGNVVGGIPYEFTDKNGDTTTVAAYEHTVIITGYNETTIRYMNNGRFYQIPTEVFLNSWGVLKNMVVYYDE